MKYVVGRSTLDPITPSRHNRLITGVSKVGIGAVLEQKGYPEIRISHNLMQCSGETIIPDTEVSFGRILGSMSSSQIPASPKIHGCH